MYARSEGVAGRAVLVVLGEELVELLALYIGGVADGKGATLGDDLFGSVGADDALEARRLRPCR